MKPQEVVDRLFENKRGVTPERVQKAKNLAQRSKLSWDDVLAVMTPDQRQQVES